MSDERPAFEQRFSTITLLAVRTSALQLPANSIKYLLYVVHLRKQLDQRITLPFVHFRESAQYFVPSKCPNPRRQGAQRA